MIGAVEVGLGPNLYYDARNRTTRPITSLVILLLELSRSVVTTVKTPGLSFCSQLSSSGTS